MAGWGRTPHREVRFEAQVGRRYGRRFLRPGVAPGFTNSPGSTKVKTGVPQGPHAAFPLHGRAESSRSRKAISAVTRAGRKAPGGITRLRAMGGGD